MKKNFLKACAVTLAGVMATSGLVFADKMDVSAGTQTSTETVTLYAGNNKVTVALSNENNKNVLPDIDQNTTITLPLPDPTGAIGIDPNFPGGDPGNTALIPGGIDQNTTVVPSPGTTPNTNGDDTTGDDSKPAEKTDTNEEGSKSSGTTTSQKKQASQPEQYVHTHEYEWVTVREATEDRDAEEVYRCRYCGDVKYRMEVPNSAYAQFNQNAISSIDRAASGAAVKLKTNLWVSFRSEVIETLKERPDVSVTIDYLYHGVWYTVTIPAGADLDALEDSEGYYGFRYLDQVFGGSLCRVSQ